MLKKIIICLSVFALLCGCVTSDAPKTQERKHRKVALHGYVYSKVKTLEETVKEAKALGALGITAAHSGTVLGVLWPLSMTKAQILSGVSRLRCFLPQLTYRGTTAMRSGGIEIDVKGKGSKDKDRSEGDEKDGNSSFCAWRQYL